MIRPNLLVDCARRLIEAAQSQDLVLRAFGGVGIRIHCPSMDKFGFSIRPYRTYDIDLVASGSAVSASHDFLTASGFSLEASPHPYRGGEHRHYRRSTAHGLLLSVDLYIGKLRFNHEVPLPYFDSLTPFTLPITQLLLSKLAIVEIGEKDMLDIASILAEHDLSKDGGPESISQRHLMKLLCAGCSGWEMAKTCGENLRATKGFVGGVDGLPHSTQTIVIERLTCLEQMLKHCRKSPCWKTRDRIGCRMFGLNVPWYDVVEAAELISR